MDNYLIINTTTNIVENTVLWDGDTNKWSPPTGSIGVTTSVIVAIGSTYNSGGVGIGTTSGNKWIVA